MRRPDAEGPLVAALVPIQMIKPAPTSAVTGESQHPKGVEILLTQILFPSVNAEFVNTKDKEWYMLSKDYKRVVTVLPF